MNLIKKRRKNLVFIFFVMLMHVLALMGCSTGVSSDPLASEESGELAVSLTDATGDFVSYTVDVVSLNLTKANGTQVSTLPLSTRIDFTQYTEMTEFLTATTLPAGVYVEATLTLDYQNADIWVEDENGNHLLVTDIVNEDGEPITTLEVSVRLEDRNRLTISPGIPAHLTLDFDLKASNRVSFDDSVDPPEPQLTVDPFLVADVDRTNESKIHRLRGLLNGVNLESSSFSVILRPFYCALSEDHRKYGIRSVITNDETIYDIDGEQYRGQDGLLVLDGLDPLTPVVALGDLKFDPLRFEAREVYAGTSVPGGEMDVVKGNVIKRNGDTLTIKGAGLIRNNGDVVFNREVNIIISDTTTVTRQFSDDFFTKDDISVGQRVVVFGILDIDDPSETLSPETAVTMDATGGAVRMLLTTIKGSMVGLDEVDSLTRLTMDLKAIDHRRVDLFDFSGTGIDAENDADPANYEVFTGNLNIPELEIASALKLKGFVEPYGLAPPDFSAWTLITFNDLRTYIKAVWDPLAETPFESISGEGLVLNLEELHDYHQMIKGWLVMGLDDLSESPLIAPEENGLGVFILKYEGVTEVHTFFEDYVDSIEALLNEEFQVKKLHATGRFNNASSILTTEYIKIWFN